MNPNLTPLQHNIASTALLLTVITLLFAGLLLPGWADYSQNTEQLSSLQDRLQRFDRLREQSDQLRRDIATLDENDALDPAAFVQGEAPALAAAELQQYLKSLVVAIGGRVISTQTLPVDESEAFPRITIKVQLKGDIVALHQVFLQLETDSPAAYVDKLFIQGQRRAPRRRRGNSAIPTAQEIDARFELSSYVTGFDS